MKTSANHSLVAVVLAAKAVETIPDTLPLIPDTLVAVVLAAKAVETRADSTLGSLLSASRSSTSR